MTERIEPRKRRVEPIEPIRRIEGYPQPSQEQGGGGAMNPEEKKRLMLEAMKKATEELQKPEQKKKWKQTGPNQYRYEE